MDKEQLLNEIIQLTEKRASLHINDPAIYDYWERYSELLSKDIENTKWVLEQVEEERLYWISEAFEDISEKLQSLVFIDFLKILQQKYPNIDMEYDIIAAKQMIEINTSYV